MVTSDVGWLFWKKVAASVRLSRAASWEEAVIEYKDYWPEINNGKIPPAIKHFREYYRRLQEK